MVAVRKDYAAPTGLEFCLGCGSTKMPRLRCYGRSQTSRRRLAIWDCILCQLLRNMLVEDFLHRQGDDDFVAALEERFDFLQRIRRIIE